MPIMPLGPFAEGLRGDFGFSGTRGIQPQTLQNLYPNRQGFLQRRGGCAHLNSTANTAMLKQVFVAPFTYEAATGIPITNPRVLAVEYSADALQLVSSSAYTSIQQGLSSGNVAIRMFNLDQATPPFKMFGGRCFIGLCASTNRGMVWCSNASLASAECYNVGRAAPAAAPTVADAVGGSLTASVYYSYRYTYYNSTHSIETAASSAASDLTTSANKTMNVTVTAVTDKGFNQYRIYRNQTGQTTAALAEAADHYLLGAISMTNGTGTVAIVDTGTTLDGTAYTIDTTQSYLDIANHDVLGELPIAMEVWNDRLWLATEPRTLKWSKKTTTQTFPDWFPTEQSISVGSPSDRITGVIASPSTEILMVFTRDGLFSITLDGPTGIDVNQFAAVGSPYPRTIKVLGEWVYFVGTDNQVWRTNGAGIQRVSRQVNHLLSHMLPSWHMLPCAAVYRDTYQLFFSSGTAVFTTTNNSVGTHTGQVVSSTVSTSARLSPSSGGWDLASVLVGMFVQSVLTPETNYGYACAVDDTNNRIDVDGNPQALAAGQYEVLYNDRGLVYNQTHDWWYELRGWNIGSADWDRICTGDFYGCTMDGAFVDTLHTTDATDADGASTAAITSLVKFEPIEAKDFRAATGKIKTNQVFLFPSGAGTSTTLNLYKDYSASVDSTRTHTPVEGENWRIGISPTGFARAWEVELTGTAAATIAAVDVEYEVL